MLASAKAPAATFTIDSKASVKMAFECVKYHAINFMMRIPTLIIKTVRMIRIFFKSSSLIFDVSTLTEVKF